MKQNKKEAGFSLIETLVAITILAAIVVPVCSSLVLSVRMNAKAEKLMLAELAVSSAVETLMAEGIAPGHDYSDLAPGVEVTVEPDESGLYYNVEISHDQVEELTVTTSIRAKGGS